jgi:hypothetical protein
MRETLRTIALCIGCSAPAFCEAGVTTVSARANLPSNDFIAWSFAGELHPNLPATFRVLSSSAHDVVVSRAPGAGFTLNQQAPTGVGEWHGNFAPGDRVLELFGVDNLISTTTIDFDVPLRGAGAQIENNLGGAFTAQLQAFNSTGTILGTYIRDGVSSGTNDNSAIFIGLQSSAQDIDRIAFSILRNGVPSDDSFAINRLDVIVPEPGALTVYLLAYASMRSRRQPSHPG